MAIISQVCSKTKGFEGGEDVPNGGIDNRRLLNSARMDQDLLRALLGDVQTGAVNVDAAMERLRHLPFEDLGFAKVDHHRALRHGIPEVVFGKGKTPDQVVGHRAPACWRERQTFW